MKIEHPIDERLLKAMSHVSNFAEHKSVTDADWKYANGLEESIALVREYVTCFGANGRVAQRGQVPSAWNKETIFEDWKEIPSFSAEEASAEQKDANAKKLLEELT